MLVDAVRKHQRIFQVGTQQRSMAMNRIACELVRTGGLGKITEVRAMNYPSSRPRPTSCFPEKARAGARLGLWLNQAAWRPYNGQWMGWSVARLRRRRNHQLGRPWHRPDSMGAGHGRNRSGGDVPLTPD